MKKVILSTLPLLLLLASCNSSTPKSNVNIGADGVSVNASGASISISPDGVSVKTPDANLNISPDGVSVNASGANINIENSLASLAIGGAALSDEDKDQYSNIIKEELATNNCSTQFNQLIKTFGNNYDACFSSRKPITSCTSEKVKGKVNVAIIFDDSGSMGAMIGNEKMINIAKEELKNYIASIDSSIAGSVIVYGHKGSSQSKGKAVSCAGIESFGDFSNASSIISKISGLEPTGWTPIDASLQYADKYLSSISGPNDQKIIVLISDGKETCGGNPVARAKTIASQKNTYIDVVGFNVYGDAQSELQQIAVNGGGKYSNVRSRADFQNVFSDMKSFAKEISCGASQAAIQLRDAADVMNTYYSCVYSLREEEVKVMTHVTAACEKEVSGLMNRRSQDIGKKLKTLEQDATQRLNNFEGAINQVLKKFQ